MNHAKQLTCLRLLSGQRAELLTAGLEKRGKTLQGAAGDLYYEIDEATSSLGGFEAAAARERDALPRRLAKLVRAHLPLLGLMLVLAHGMCQEKFGSNGWLSVVVWGWQEQMVAEQAEREAALQKRYADLQRERAALTAS